MRTPRTGIRLLKPQGKEKNEVAGRFAAAVSLHCHTEQSKEILNFIPYYAGKIPLVAGLLQREVENHRIRKGEVIDFNRAYWTPPIPPRAVLEAESAQIEQFGLDPLVSITDHDDIGACLHLQVVDPDRDVPVSLEWTVPFREGFFHVGVHNLPRERSGPLWELLKDYTRNPESHDLAGLLELLNQSKDTLLVLNHPLWDIEHIGLEPHRQLLDTFISIHGRSIHAIEVNGYRTWAENKKAIELAAAHGFPIISGGDRHGLESNSILNLTSARTFSEFASEIRADRVSEVAILPAYKEPVVMRMLEAAGDILRYYPNYPKGQRYWTDRVFWTLEDESVRPMSFYWKKGGPAWVRASLRIMRVIGSRRVRPAMRLVFAGEEGVNL